MPKSQCTLAQLTFGFDVNVGLLQFAMPRLKPAAHATGNADQFTILLQKIA